MKQKKYTVTIGIPAYNEAENIGYLLHELIGQKQDGFIIDRILIASDNSTDKTKEIVEAINDPRIEFLDYKNRRGQAYRQNQMIQRTKSDILVLLNADIALDGPLFLRDLIDPIIHDNADLTSSNMLCMQPSSFLERVLYTGFITRNDMFEAYHEGNNMYTCHGAARAFSKRLYSKLRFKSSIGEDGFSYLFAVTNRFIYKYAPKATARVKLPDTLKDHEKQSVRFFVSSHEWKQEFGEDVVKEHHRLPINLVIIKSCIAASRHPVYAICYLAILLSMMLKSQVAPHVSQTWDSSASSKRLNRSQ